MVTQIPRMPKGFYGRIVNTPTPAVKISGTKEFDPRAILVLFYKNHSKSADKLLVLNRSIYTKRNFYYAKSRKKDLFAIA